ncbi:MAG TPA: hypothetical protein VN823_26610 [Stellaceae bacterium]|nr:hypothetical protein [Stellaceae bacterium]
MLRAPLVISYGTDLGVTIEPDRPLRLSTMAWDFPERPDLIALTSVSDRLDFLRDHLKSLCGIWDKLPRLFLDAYFRDIGACIARDRSAIEGVAAGHGGLFRPEDWSFAALCPLPRARLPAAPETPVDFAFWTGETFHAVEIAGGMSQSRARRDRLARLKETGNPAIEIPGAELEHGRAGDLRMRLPAPFSDFWKTVALPSSPFRIGALDEILST